MTILKSMRILVTGGAKRVGKVIADDLESAGALVYRSVRIDGDLREAEGCRLIVDRAVKVLKGLDAVVISASQFRRTPFDELIPSDWDDMMSTNLRSAFLITMYAATRIETGSVVIIGDGATARPHLNYLPYLVSKAALRPLVETLALELAPRIRVNMVSPGTILPPEGTSSATLERIREAHPMNMIGSPSHILPAIRDCLTNSFMTGAEIRVDGGKGI
ncbi:MAG: SDR family oxidoreductase [Candidatus Hydrogenedentota bacterium]